MTNKKDIGSWFRASVNFVRDKAVIALTGHHKTGDSIIAAGTMWFIVAKSYELDSEGVLTTAEAYGAFPRSVTNKEVSTALAIIEQCGFVTVTSEYVTIRQYRKWQTTGSERSEIARKAAEARWDARSNA